MTDAPERLLPPLPPDGERAVLAELFTGLRNRYAGSQLADECQHRHGGCVNQELLADCLERALVLGDEAPCQALVRRMGEANVPFMIVSHEIAFLRDALIREAVHTGQPAAVTAAVSFFDTLLDHLASVFLKDYLRDLATRNHVRLQHIAALSEKNLLVYFERHLAWMERLTEAVARRDPAAMPEVDHERCDFGRWLHEEGIGLIRDRSHYKEIVRIHATMHTVVAELSQLLKGTASLPILAQLKRAETYSLDLGNEISMLNSLVIMSVYSKDPMTGLLTRRSLDRIMLNQLEISRATETPFCVLMGDLDHFKAINDRHGHAVGDRALLHFVDRMRDVLRQSDLIFRYGGEEFLVILPSTEYAQGLRLAETLVQCLNGSPLKLDGGDALAVQCSFGLLEVNGLKTPFIDNEVVHDVIRECDRKLYIAKHRGRNQVA